MLQSTPIHRSIRRIARYALVWTCLLNGERHCLQRRESQTSNVRVFPHKLEDLQDYRGTCHPKFQILWRGALTGCSAKGGLAMSFSFIWCGPTARVWMVFFLISPTKYRIKSTKCVACQNGSQRFQGLSMCLEGLKKAVWKIILQMLDKIWQEYLEVQGSFMGNQACLLYNGTTTQVCVPPIYFPNVRVSSCIAPQNCDWSCFMLLQDSLSSLHIMMCSSACIQLCKLAKHLSSLLTEKLVLLLLDSEVS